MAEEAGAGTHPLFLVGVGILPGVFSVARPGCFTSPNVLVLRELQRAPVCSNTRWNGAVGRLEEWLGVGSGHPPCLGALRRSLFGAVEQGCQG